VTTDYLGQSAGRGQCRVHCDGGCEPQGGVAFSCLQGGAGGCYPGRLGVPCTLPTDCIAPLTCQDLPPEADLDAGSTRICSSHCAVVGDASADTVCGLQGYCDDDAGSCRLRRDAGDPCSRDGQCGSQHCKLANGTCLPPTAPPGG
jgi:hypothetical protein